MYRIRFHGRGGQGMKTASRILGSAFFAEGFEVQDAPRYGAERRGAPIFAYVRAARDPIHERGIISHPDLVIVADETLVPSASAGVLMGSDPETILLINSKDPPEVWRERLHMSGSVLTTPPLASEEEELRYIGAVCAGAAARLVGSISRQALEGAVRAELHALGERVVDENLKRALDAYDVFAPHTGRVTESAELRADEVGPPDWVDVPSDDATLGAPDIHAAGTSVEVRTGLWRTLRPVIDRELCHGCHWVCVTFCPDGAITADADGAPQIDYDHCKGCLVCVAVCPPHAIHAIPERDAAAPAQEGVHS